VITSVSGSLTVPEATPVVPGVTATDTASASQTAAFDAPMNSVAEATGVRERRQHLAFVGQHLNYR
jgi:hypothetical protein